LFEVSVPGSVMFMGEHAVLHGYPAIVGAINRRITATLIPRSDKKINIVAEKFGELKLSLNAIVSGAEQTDKSVKKFNYVFAAIQQLHDIIHFGFDLQIRADFSDQLGLGSSAAVTVAVLAVISKWAAGKIDLVKIHELGVRVVHAVQNGLGSGADIAASVYGGVVFYQTQPLQIKKISAIPQITLVYAGYKTPTVAVIKKINQQAEKSPNYFNDLYQTIGNLVMQGVGCFERQDWQQLGQLFLAHFDAQRALGVSDENIDSIVEKLKNISTVCGAKISGAGLGDCIIALGQVDDSIMQSLNVSIDEQGIICNQ